MAQPLQFVTPSSDTFRPSLLDTYGPLQSHSTNNPVSAREQGVSARLVLIWQMGEASLTATGNEIRLPLNMSKQLHDFEVIELEKRLSAKFKGALVTRYEDHQLGILRITAATSTMSSACDSPVSHCSTMTTMSPLPITHTGVMTAESRKSSKKLKVPRPPNAFILYRKHWHPKIKEGNPDMRNNDISVILGRQWQEESDVVRQTWKDKAEQIKLKHAADNPGYQYAPRKSSEKKRRMTAKKLGKLQQGQDGENATASPDTHGLEDANQLAFADGLELQGMGLTDQIPLPSFEDYFNLEAPVNTEFVALNADNNIDVNMPLPDNALLDDFCQAYETFDFNSITSSAEDAVSQATPAHVVNNANLMNDLIDYNGLMESFDTIRRASAQTMASLDEFDAAHPSFKSFNVADFATFQAELDRASDLTK